MFNCNPFNTSSCFCFHLDFGIDVFLQTSNDYSMLKDYLDKESGTRFVENLVTTLYWQVDQVYQFTTNPFSKWQKVTSLNISLSLE